MTTRPTAQKTAGERLLSTLTHGNDQMMKSMRKELDKVNNAMKGKTTINLDGMIKKTDSPFTASVLDAPCLPNSVSHSWRSTMALRIPWIT